MLPLRDTVLFPELVHAARGGARELRPADRRGGVERQSDRGVHAARGERRRTAAGRSVPGRDRQPHPQDVQAAGRQPAHHRAGAGARAPRPRWSTSARTCAPASKKPSRCSSDDDRLEIDALQRNIKTNFQQIVSLSPLMSDDLQTLAMNIAEPGRLADFIASSLGSISTETRQEVLDNARRAAAARCAEPAADQGARSARARLEDSVAGAVGGRQEPARLLPARAAQGDSARAGRRRRSDQGDRRASHQDRSRGHARHRQERSAARARSVVEDAAGGRRIHRLAHLPRLADRAAVGQADRRGHRPPEDARDAQQGSLGPREGQGPHPRVPRRA